MHDEQAWRWTPEGVGRPFREWDLAAGQRQSGNGWVEGWNVLGVRGSYRGTPKSEIRTLALNGRAIPGARATRGRFVLVLRDGTLEWGTYQNVDRFVVTDLVLTSASGRRRTFRFEAMQLDPKTRRVERFRVAELLSDGRSTRRAQVLTRAAGENGATARDEG
ncbi:MAG TPA: hypothetical protein VGK67_24980 [Myxococcales bacterium]|jgi:hypothetical protein